MKAQECKSEDLSVMPVFSIGKSLTSLGLRVPHLLNERGYLLGEGSCLLVFNSVILRHMKNFLTCESVCDMMFLKNSL